MDTLVYELAQAANGWTLIWAPSSGTPVQTVLIGRAYLSWEEATDAACEFMDRWPVSDLPNDILMDQCVRNMQRQR